MLRKFKISYLDIILYLALVAIAYTIIFAHMERLPLHIWDEAHRAVNAQEILRNNEWIVITFDDQPDLYGTKPPLLVWTQAVFMKIFGMGELAVRLPSALSGLSICLLMFWIFHYYVRNKWIALMSILTLLSSYGFIYVHGIRYGDTDVMLTLWISLLSLYYYRYIQTGAYKHLYIAIVFLALATLTKSVAAFLFLPGLFVFTITSGKLKSIITNKHFYFAILLYIGMISWYYIIREIKLPGYIHAVWENEIGGRFFKPNDGHDQSFWYYLYMMKLERFYFIWFLCGLPILIFIKDKKLKQVISFVFIMAISYLFMISISQTKIAWYDIPLYPFFAILVATIIYIAIKLFWDKIIKNSGIKVDYLHYIIVLVLFFTPISRIIDFTFNPKQKPWSVDFYHISYYLRNKIDNNCKIDEGFILEPEDLGLRAGIPFHLPHMMFYSNIMNEGGSNLKYKPKEEIKIGDYIITNSQPCKDYIEENFMFDFKEEYKNVLVYQITEVRN